MVYTSRSLHLRRKRYGCGMNSRRARVVLRNVSSRKIYASIIGKILFEVATNLHRDYGGRSGRTPAGPQPQYFLWRRVLYLFIFVLSFIAAATTFAVVVLKVSQTRSKSLLSGGTQAIVLAIFSTPSSTNVFATVVLIFRAFYDARAEDQSDPQACLETHRILIMNVIEACVLYPAIVFNFIEARVHLDPQQNTLDIVYDVTMVVFALGWITLWFSGTPAERARKWLAAVRSKRNNNVGARGTNCKEPREDTCPTSDSFRDNYDVEAVTSDMVAN